MTAVRRMQAVFFGVLTVLMGPSVAADPSDQAVEVTTVGQPLYPGATAPARVPAILRLPQGAGPFPAVVIVHGSAGVDGRGAALATELRQLGIASLELDMWKPRGLTGGTGSRPRIISDTLPDTWGAWEYLAADPRVDAKRIGIAGFSWGGALAWITAFGLKPLNAPATTQAARFAAHVPFYGGCSSYLPSAKGGKALAALGAKPTGAPMLYVIGTKDDYETSSKACSELAKAYPQVGMQVRSVEGATHGFDGPDYARFDDSLARDGAGNSISVKSDPDAARVVRKEVALFFQTALGK